MKRFFGHVIPVRLKFHWPLVLIAVLALPLLFLHLGSDYLWEDEGDTAVLAVNILKSGLPRAWDGVTFCDSDAGARLNDELVMVSHPWLQYYLTAASFFVFGQNNCAARLPFALAGWLAILATYLCAYDLTKNRWIALCSAALLTGSVQFLLFSRQCRYYPLNMLLGCLLVWAFLRMRSVRSAAVFAIVAILLFHSHPFGIALVGALGVISFAYPFTPGQWRFFCWATLPIAILTLPWVFLARSGYAQNYDPLTSTAQFGGRLVQYLIESASVTPLVGVVLLASILALLRILRRRSIDPSGAQQDRLLDRKQLGFLFTTLVTLLCYAAVMGIAVSSDNLARLGLRYTTAVMPLIAIAAGLLIVNISRGQVAIWLPLLLIFVFTKVAQLTPWIFWGHKFTKFDGNEAVQAHLPRRYIDRYLSTGELAAFLRDLNEENPGTLAKICQFLQEHAYAGDLVATNYDWEPLYFYTRLPQALKIFPQYPIYQTARRKGLPEYVFNLDRVRWVIWRPVWNGYQGYVGSEIKSNILKAGARITQVAQFPETIHENRPEIHFHRFSGGKYFFYPPTNSPSAYIVRVDWPGVLSTPPSEPMN